MKNRKTKETAESEESKKEDNVGTDEQAAIKKQIAENIEKGKIEAAPSKQEREAAETKFGAVAGQKGRKGKKPREGPSAFYYEDDNRLNLDYVMVKNFSKIGISPPIDVAELESTQEKITTLRNALTTKGKITQLEGKAKFLKDPSWTESDDYGELKKTYQDLKEDVHKLVDTINREKLNWDAVDDFEDGINVDEEIGEEEIGQRFTRL